MRQSYAKQTEATTAAETARPASDESIKETFQSIIIAFILAFIFRAYVVEAFVIPTGSMAPTLLGQHTQVRCAQCGYEFDVDTESGAGSDAACPMCAFANPIPRGSYNLAGDRILVHKYVYALTEPRRWDVVVFKAPHRPDTNFIKRLVGLPNEQLYILDGNLYVRRVDANGQPVDTSAQATWHIARKVDPRQNRNWQKIQRTVWQPIYHSQYVPLDGGTPSSEIGGRDNRQAWRLPWQAVDNKAAWLFSDPAAGRTPTARPSRQYHYTDSEPGRIAFDFAAGRFAWRDARYAYNQLKASGPTDEPIEDIRLAADFLPERDGLEVELATTARLDLPDGVAKLTARIDANGVCSLWRTDPAPDGGILEPRQIAEAQTAGLPSARPTQVELWYVDQTALVFREGEQVLRYNFDAAWTDLLQRDQAPDVPEITITVSGSPVSLHRVELDRDLYYSAYGNKRARGGLPRDMSGIVMGNGSLPDPVHLGPHDFFVIGDNNPASDDSRFWNVDGHLGLTADPWVMDQILGGAERPGIVPRRLMIGRAFFVYFPAPYKVNARKWGFLPNFGDMRFIH